MEDEESLKQNIPCYLQGFNSHYMNTIPSAFKYMTYHTKIWRVVLINDIFNELCDLANIRTTWQERTAPLKATAERKYGMDAGADGFLLEFYRDELNKPRHIRFITRYQLSSFI